MNRNAQAPVASVFDPIALLRHWFKAKALDRDVAFRERIIRVTLAIIIVLGLLSLSLNILVFRGEFALVSHYTMHIVALTGCFVAAALVSRSRVLEAGSILTLTVLFGASSLILLGRQAESVSGVVNGIPALMLVPIVATLVLPRNMIMLISFLTVAIYALAQFLLPINDFEFAGIDAVQQLTVTFPLLMVEGALLRQLRVEFDDRLETLQQSLRQTELARQEADAARQRAEIDRQRAESADKAKTQFLANMSHELRTPLNAIIGYDEAMLGGMVGAFTPKQTELLGRIQHNSRRLLGLINDVLDLSKIESGSLEIFLAPMSPPKVVTETVESLRSLAHENKIALEVEIRDDLPELVLGDANKLQQILVNLVSNAIKFTEKGGVTVTAGASDSDHWQVTVRDTGIGIAPDALNYIFEPFRQADSSETRKHKGTGLGLSITKRLAEKMGGAIAVESTPGSGSTFTVTLPRVNVPEPAVSSNGASHA